MHGSYAYVVLQDLPPATGGAGERWFRNEEEVTAKKGKNNVWWCHCKLLLLFCGSVFRLWFWSGTSVAVFISGCLAFYKEIHVCVRVRERERERCSQASHAYMYSRGRPCENNNFSFFFFFCNNKLVCFFNRTGLFFFFF